MIDKKTLARLKGWFEEYVDAFHTGGHEHDRNIDLKINHTWRVCFEILDIGRTLHLNHQDLRLAEVIALYHDIGRFEQYDRYGTFNDLKSEDHAKLGVKILKTSAALEGIDRDTRELILRVVGYHNGRTLPEHETATCILFTKLLRDADKLDIFRVVTDYYLTKAGSRNESIELDLPDTPDVSEAVYADVAAGRIVKMDSLRTFNDFKLLQMAWIYDVNFPRTFQLIRDRGYLEIIRNALPQSEKIANLCIKARACLEAHCSVEQKAGS